MSKHYLYSTWNWLFKQQNRHTVQPEWSDFKVFVQDIGNRPSEQYRLRKFNSELGYIRGNVGWNLMFKEQEGQHWNVRNKDKIRNYKLKHKFKISSDDYDKMSSEQDDKCFICSKTSSENKKRLAIDHNHETGVVRKLLCNDCNALLGFCKEDVGILQKSIDYLNTSF